ncbi:MAG: AMP-binding protein [Pseudomonadota bacterium]
MNAQPAVSSPPLPDALIARLCHYASLYPDSEAVVSVTRILTYAELVRVVHAQYVALRSAGMSANDVIGIRCAEDIPHLILCLAATQLGATSCTIPTHASEQAQTAVIASCGATQLVDESITVDVDSCLRDSHQLELPPFTSNVSARLLFSTSGTTGEPKLVVHQDVDLVAQAHRHVESRQERFAVLASMEHNFAKRHRLYCVAAGGTNVFIDSGRSALVADCRQLDVNVLHVSAFQAQELLALPHVGQLSDLRLKLGGSHVPLPLRQQLRQTITTNLQAGYGTTETGAIGFTDPTDEDAGESVGQPLPGIEIQAVDEHRQPLPAGQRGELAIRARGMFREYLHQPELTTARLQDNWFYTGDIGYLDDKQRIHLCGRADDMFVFNSMNIFPQDIESEIRRYPKVVDVAVLPRKSAVHGDIPVALVVFAKNVKPKLPALRKFVHKRVGERSPRQYIIVDEIPTNASGKIARREAMQLPTQSNQLRSNLIDALAPELRERLKPGIVRAFKHGDVDINLDDLGMDSMARMDFLVTLEVEFNTIITPKAFNEFRYLGHVVARIMQPAETAATSLDDAWLTRMENPLAGHGESPPYVVLFVRRVLSYCRSVAQVNQALATLEHRLTPGEVACLGHWQAAGALLPEQSEPRQATAVNAFLKQMLRDMARSGNPQPQPFVLTRLAPTASLFVGPGADKDKMLLVCFAASGVRHMMVPNAVLLQHLDASGFDVLIIGEPRNQSYQAGVPILGESLRGVVQWLTAQPFTKQYRDLRTFGFSAGGHPALVSAYHLRATLAVSVSGRFRKRYRMHNFSKLLSTCRSMLLGHRPRVLLCHAVDNRRDRRYARTMARLCGGTRVAIDIGNANVGHFVLQRMLDAGELGNFLGRTVQAPADDRLLSDRATEVRFNFPGNHDSNTD